MNHMIHQFLFHIMMHDEKVDIDHLVLLSSCMCAWMSILHTKSLHAWCKTWQAMAKRVHRMWDDMRRKDGKNPNTKKRENVQHIWFLLHFFSFPTVILLQRKPPKLPWKFSGQGHINGPATRWLRWIHGLTAIQTMIIERKIKLPDKIY